MYTYTMTFVSGEEIALPESTVFQEKVICDMITEKLARHEMVLADFNWSGAYSFNNSLSYLKSPYCVKCVVEVRITLDSTTILSREAIYNRCLQALKQQEVLLKRSHYIKNKKSVTEQCVLSFDMKTAA